MSDSTFPGAKDSARASLGGHHPAYHTLLTFLIYSPTSIMLWELPSLNSLEHFQAQWTLPFCEHSAGFDLDVTYF